MAKYRKKPVVVDAFQMTAARRVDNADWPDWLLSAWQEDYETKGAVYPVSTALYIHTLTGPVLFPVDWWAIRGVHGELYPCKPDIFEMTYEAVE